MIRENKTVPVTARASSFGGAFVPMNLGHYNPKYTICYARDELKQCGMEMKCCDGSSVRFVMSDVRDKEGLLQILKGVDDFVHATATKILPTGEYNISEHIKFNINGADFSCALDNNPKLMIVEEPQRWIDKCRSSIGKI